MLRLAFAAPARNGYYEAVLRGFKAWTRSWGDVALASFLGAEELDWRALEFIEVDGALVASARETEIPAVARTLPQVSFSNHRTKRDIPYVINDDEEVGRLGARVLAAAGYRRLALVDRPEPPGEFRSAGFRAEAERLGLPVQGHARSLAPSPGGVSLKELVRDSIRRLREFVESLPAGTGIFCCAFHDAVEVEQMLREHRPGTLPDEIGLLAGDVPPSRHGNQDIAHVKLAGERIGALAGELLLGLVRGTEPPGRRIVRVPPLGHEPGRTLRPDELTRLVSRLRAYLEANLARDIGVEDLCAHLGLSRRTLESRLRAAALPSPYATLIDLRIERAATLLLTTDLPIERIAEQVGFSECRTFTKRFRSRHGVPPRTWRRRHGAA